MLLGLNLSFFSSDILVQFLRDNADNKKFNGSSRYSERSSGRQGNIFEEFQPSADSTSQARYARASDRDPGDPSTSGPEKELTSEDEVARLLNCTDHYSALGFRRYENIDVSSLKREYKKKVMLKDELKHYFARVTFQFKLMFFQSCDMVIIVNSDY